MAYISDYKTKHKAIWAEYETMYHDIYTSTDTGKRSTLIIDGAVNLEKYKGILFLLKEAYAEKASVEQWDICSWLNQGVRYSMWNRVAEWTYGIQNTTANSIPRYRELNSNEKLSAIQSIGLVNIKKINGNKNSDAKELRKIAQENRDILRLEIEALQPKIIVCGYTGDCLLDIFGKPFKSKGNYCDNLYYCCDLSSTLTGVTVLDYYHPAAQYPATMSYYGITNIYQQSLNDTPC